MQLYIDGLSDEMSEKDLMPLFSGAGSLESVKVIRDIESGESRRFALATVANDKDGQEAITRLNGSTLSGRKLTVFKIHDTLPGEMEFREWLRNNAVEALDRVGVKRSQTVVDYGCGPGIFTMAAASLVGPGGRVYALDVRPSALERVRGLASEGGLANVDTILIKKETVPVALGEGSADMALLYDVLQEVPDKPGLMRELHRILKPGGVLSVFPMHLGTQKLLDLVEAVGLFRVRDRYCVSGFQSASEIVNLTAVA
ncbi:MAG: hypothetical protein A2147_07875 [Chloroflexi bacterium RBG_16_57_8]|nr:MAG: hypothetical protein A2147_07875 [Chloroflexi bacterium RBG_16_57_8]